MKKLFVVLLAGMLVLSMGVASMAALTISGDATFTNDFSVNQDNTDPNKNDSAKLDLNLYFKNTVSETVDWTLRLNMSDRFIGTPIFETVSVPGDEDGDGTVEPGEEIEVVQKVTGMNRHSSIPWLREAYSNVKLSAGTLRFGLWEIKPYSSIGILADNTDSVMGRMKDAFAIGYTSPQLFPGFTAGLVYFLDGSDASEWDNRMAVAPGAYVANFTYKAGMVFADLYYVNTAIDGQDAGYALNMKLTPIDVLTIGLNWGTRAGSGTQKEAQIIELQYKQDAFYVKYGMDLNNDAATGIAGTHDRSAYSIGYALSNGITLEYRSKDLKAGSDPTQELRIMCKF